MPPTPNKEDIQATYVVILRTRTRLADTGRWTFLQTGVEKIMRNLREGVDMQTVGGSFHAFCGFTADFNDSVYGDLHVRPLNLWYVRWLTTSQGRT